MSALQRTSKMLKSMPQLFSRLGRHLQAAGILRMLRGPTYSAFYQKDHSRIIYRHKPDDGTLAQLPDNAQPADDPRSTYNRNDGGDPFEFALFRTNGGLLIVVQKDGHVPRRNVVGRQTTHPRENYGDQEARPHMGH